MFLSITRYQKNNVKVNFNTYTYSIVLIVGEVTCPVSNSIKQVFKLLINNCQKHIDKKFNKIVVDFIIYYNMLSFSGYVRGDFRIKLNIAHSEIM